MPGRSPALGSGNALVGVLRRPGGGGRELTALKAVDLDRTGPIAELDDVGQIVVFPVSALFGLISVLPDGPEVEVATIGWEGVVGYPAATAGDARGTRLLCHIPGRALQMPLQTLLDRLDRDGVARSVFDHHAAMSAALLAQRAACGQRHAASGRYATWLLACADRLGTATPIPLSQQLLAVILGLQRTTVSTIAGRLEDQGLTGTRYGTVQILDRRGLAAVACACYPRYRRQVRGLLDHARVAVTQPPG